MLSTLLMRRGVRGALPAALVAGASLLAVAPAADAALGSRYLYYVTYPGSYQWDGGGVEPPAERADNGYYDGSVSQYPNYADTLLPGYVAPTVGICGSEESTSNGQTIKYADHECYTVEQLRGGAALKASNDDGSLIPTRLLAGDTLRVYNPDTKATLFETAVTAPAPVISSVIGSTDVTIGRTADSREVYVTLQRRVARNVDREQFVPGTYQWVAGPAGSGDTLCYQFIWDAVQRKVVEVNDTAPPAPTTAPPAGQAWVLDRTQNCSTKDVAIPGAPYEIAAVGRLVAVSEGQYTVRFDQPLQAGDVVRYSETHTTIAGDVDTTITRANVAPVGTVPPPDTAAPKVTRFDLGAANTSIKSFLKFGLATFVATDEPSTVTQQLLLPAPKEKKKKKGKKKPKQTAPVVIASGSAKTTAPGETAKIVLFSTKDGRKALKKLGKGKPAKTTLVTTVTDAVGNTVRSESPVKLSSK